LKLRVEIDTRAHEHLLGIRAHRFVVDGDGYRGVTAMAFFEPEALFGTALYWQTRRGPER
jgi:hypothetical protein